MNNSRPGSVVPLIRLKHLIIPCSSANRCATTIQPLAKLLMALVRLPSDAQFLLRYLQGFRSE
ncbi:MAG: hypothetical protein ACTXOO_05095 [Sodalis sp. (in: enterobacteria)]